VFRLQKIVTSRKKVTYRPPAYIALQTHFEPHIFPANDVASSYIPHAIMLMLRRGRCGGGDAAARDPGSSSSTATDVAPLLSSYLLTTADLAQLRLVCRAWRVAMDKATTRLAVYAPPPLPGVSSSTGPRSSRSKASSGLLAHVHALSCALPVQIAIHAGGAHCRAAAARSRWGLQLARALPGLSSLQLQCSVPGIDDLHQLSRLRQLQHVTLLDFPFNAAAAPGGGADGVGSGAMIHSTVGRCSSLRTLCLQSDLVSSFRVAECGVEGLAGLGCWLLAADSVSLPATRCSSRTSHPTLSTRSTEPTPSTPPHPHRNSTCWTWRG